MKTVFLSSTYDELAEHREAVVNAIEGLDGFHCVRMETFGARDEAADEFCRKLATECDVFVGVIGHRYGAVHQASDTSYAVREYEAAVTANKPRLVFLAAEDLPVPGNLRESDSLWRRQRDFRQRLNRERIRDTFTTATDLVNRVVSAIHNLSREPTTAPRTGSVPVDAAMPYPPQPYFAHPYGLQNHFTGRVSERSMLTNWLSGDPRPVIVLEALGGMGKSALAWAWVQRDVLGFALPGSLEPAESRCVDCRVPAQERPEGLFWWSFYDREAGFYAFLGSALAYAGAGHVDPSTFQSTYDRMQALLGVLQQRRILLVLDGFERALAAYSGLRVPHEGDGVAEEDGADTRSCVDPHASRFLSAAASLHSGCRIVITTRVIPRELDDLAGCRRERLGALSREDAVAFFRAQGVRATRAEIEEVCNPYGFHPLALRLLTGVIVRPGRRSGDVSRAAGRSVIPELEGSGHHDILGIAYETLDTSAQSLLSRIAAFRSPVDDDAIAAISPYGQDANRVHDAINTLSSLGLLLFDPQSERHDLHPIVRQYAYSRLSDKTGVHRQLREYFLSSVPDAPTKPERIEDLAAVIELYYHTACAGMLDEAAALYDRHLSDPLYYQFGAYEKCIELLRLLDPSSGSDIDSDRTIDVSSWVINDLANSYALSGHPVRAAVLFKRHNELRDSEGDKRNLAVGLQNLAHMAQMYLGSLREAEDNLRRSIASSHETSYELLEALGHKELGRLLAYTGRYEEARSELQIATTAHEAGGAIPSLCVAHAYIALCELLQGNFDRALAEARVALDLASDQAGPGRPIERNRIRAEWLAGGALVLLSGCSQPSKGDILSEADAHLTEALMRCRRINMVDLEPDIVLTRAKWHLLKGHEPQALADAEEALGIADRCGYRLCQADIHTFLAELALASGDTATAAAEASVGRERAWCDGPPNHAYRRALDGATRILTQLGERVPTEG